MLVCMFMKIGFCFNIKRNLPSTDPKAQVDAEFDSPETITAIRNALKAGGHMVFEIEADDKAYGILKRLKTKIDIVFNIAEGIFGDAREAQIPSICDLLQIPYTHSRTLVHALTLNKALTKKILSYHHIPTPKFQLFSSPHDQLDESLNFPLFLKPNAEGSSKGILNSNLVGNKTTFQKRLKALFNTYAEQVLAEEYMPGREFTVALLGNPPRILPIVEQRFDSLPEKYMHFTSYEVKWIWEDTLSDMTIAYDCPAHIPKILAKKIGDVSLAAFKSLECYDCARVDFRLDNNDQPAVLEINTLPGLMPANLGVSYFPIAAQAGGLSYNQMILAIVEVAIKRYHL